MEMPIAVHALLSGDAHAYVKHVHVQAWNIPEGHTALGKGQGRQWLRMEHSLPQGILALPKAQPTES